MCTFIYKKVTSVITLVCFCLKVQALGECTIWIIIILSFGSYAIIEHLKNIQVLDLSMFLGKKHDRKKWQKIVYKITFMHEWIIIMITFLYDATISFKKHFLVYLRCRIQQVSLYLAPSLSQVYWWIKITQKIEFSGIQN